MNYRDLIKKLSNLQVGDVVITKKDFTANDLDFSKSAKSWIGINIVSSNNLNKSDLHNFKKGDVLYICTEKPEFNLNLKYIKLAGYEYYVTGSLDKPDYNTYLIRLSTWPNTYNYSALSTQIMGLGLEEDYLEIFKYDNLPAEIKDKIKIRFLINRIYSCLFGNYYIDGGIPLLLNNYMLIKDYNLTKQGIEFSGFKYDKENSIYHKKTEDIFVPVDDILNMIVGITLDYSIFGTSLNGNPFDDRFNKLLKNLK